MAVSAGFAASLATAGPTSAQTTQAKAAVGTLQFPCGFFRENDRGKYGHCDAPPRTDVVINVVFLFGGEQTWCVKPGVTDLGPFATNAWYIGQLCDAG